MKIQIIRQLDQMHILYIEEFKVSWEIDKDEKIIVKSMLSIGDIIIMSKDVIQKVKMFKSYCPTDPTQIEGTYIVTNGLMRPQDELILLKNLKESDFKIQHNVSRSTYYYCGKDH